MPNYVSIDGKNLPALFLKVILPWMIQSPLMPNIAILMASYSQRLERGLNVDPSQTLTIKAHVLSLVNQYIKQDFMLVSDEAIRAVTHLVILEVCDFLEHRGVKKVTLDSGGGVLKIVYGRI